MNATEDGPPPTDARGSAMAAIPSSQSNIGDLNITRDWVHASVNQTLEVLGTLLKQLRSSRTNIETFSGILIEGETLLKSLDKSIVEVVSISKLEKKVLVAEEYEEDVCHMRTRVRIALASLPPNAGGWFSSNQVDPATQNHHDLADYV